MRPLHRPTLDQEWQRRAFGLAVALAEFGHCPWEDFQQQISAIGSWHDAPEDSRGRWEYYQTGSQPDCPIAGPAAP